MIDCEGQAIIAQVNREIAELEKLAAEISRFDREAQDQLNQDAWMRPRQPDGKFAPKTPEKNLTC